MSHSLLPADSAIVSNERDTFLIRFECVQPSSTLQPSSSSGFVYKFTSSVVQVSSSSTIQLSGLIQSSTMAHISSTFASIQPAQTTTSAAPEASSPVQIPS